MARYIKYKRFEVFSQTCDNYLPTTSHTWHANCDGQHKEMLVSWIPLLHDQSCGPLEPESNQHLYKCETGKRGFRVGGAADHPTSIMISPSWNTGKFPNLLEWLSALSKDLMMWLNLFSYWKHEEVENNFPLDVPVVQSIWGEKRHVLKLKLILSTSPSTSRLSS